MNNRPLSVTIIAWVYLGSGATGLIYHASEWNQAQPFQSELLWICLIRFVAMVAGAGLLRGRAWARSLSLVWMTYHVILSCFHSPLELLMHTLLLLVIAFVLSRPKALAFVQSGRGKTAAV